MEQHKIFRLLRKIRFLQLLSFTAQCGALAGTGYLVWKLAQGVEQQYLWSSPLLLSLVAGSLLLFSFSRSLAWIVSRKDHTNALDVDRIYGLKDRLTTYIELKDSNHPFLPALIRETAAQIDSVSALRSSRAKSSMVLPAALFILVASALLTLPYLPVPETIIARKQEQKRIAEKGKELETLVRRLEKQSKQLPEFKGLSNEFKQLSQQLQKPDFDKADALKKLNELQENQNRVHSATGQKLVEQLKNAWQEAAKPDLNEPQLSADEKATVEQLARDFDAALEGQAPSAGEEKEKLNQGQFSKQDLKKLKEALKKYQDQKSSADQMRAEMQEALDKTRKATSSGKNAYIADSRLKDRDVEKGKGGVQDGPGTTNQDAGPSQFDTAKKSKEEYVEDRTRADYERRYQGERTQAGKDPLFLESQWDEDGNPQYTRVRHFGRQQDIPNKNGAGRNIAEQNQNESAVRKERIPASHQQIVKKYFEAIEE